MNKAIILTALGDRKKSIKRTINNIREYDKHIDIYLYTDNNINIDNTIYNRLLKGNDIKWQYHKFRYAYRMTDYWRIKAMLELKDKYDMFLYMDDDMEIINPCFFHIFDITELFKTVTLIASPRHYMGYDARRGVDSPFKIVDKYYYAFGYNSGIVCVYINRKEVIEYLENYLQVMLDTPGRGPVIFWQAAHNTGFYPYVLQEEWMVTGLSAEKIYHGRDTYPPLCLHISDSNVRSIFNAKST